MTEGTGEVSRRDAQAPLHALLARLVSARCKPEQAGWLLARLEEVARSGEPSGPFASCGRRFGAALLELDEEERRLLRDESQALFKGAQDGQAGIVGLPEPLFSQLRGRPLDELARTALLLAAMSGEAARDRLPLELFQRGDAGEKQAVLRALPLLPRPARFVEIGVEAVRSSVQTVFEAIACENAFPADHFSDPQFNQLVLKALFNGVATARVFGLSLRAGAELDRMVQGYAAERRAAGRSVPDDIETISQYARSAR